MKSFWKIAIVVCLIIILYLSMCKGDSEPPNLYEQEHKELVEKVKQDSIKRYNDSLKYVRRFAELYNQRLDVILKLDAAEIKLYQTTATVNRLAGQVEYYKSIKQDSTFKPVSPRYIESCDSLATVAVEQGKQIEQAKKDVEQAWDLLNYEVYIRDSAIQEQRKDYAQLRADFNAQTHFFELAIKNGKPRTKVFIGGETFFNDKIPVSGAGVTLDLLTKKNKQIGVGGGFQTLRYELPGGEKKTITDWYGKVSYKFLISFKK